MIRVAGAMFLLGLFLGFGVRRGQERPPSEPAPHTSPEPTAANPTAIPCVRAAEVHRTQALLRRARVWLEHAEHRLSEVYGEPPVAPSDWNGPEARQFLSGAARDAGADIVEVNCDEYPCVVLLAARDPFDGASLNELGVSAGDAKVLVGGIEMWSLATFAYPNADWTPEEARWIRHRLSTLRRPDNPVFETIDDRLIDEERDIALDIQ